MDSMTDEEGKVVEELKKRTINDLTPKQLEDVSLFFRFAKARDFNLEHAETMLRKHIAWRKEMEVDTILTDYESPEVLAKYNPACFACFDKAGCAVLFHDCGRIDIKGFMNAADKMEILKFMVYFIEQMKEVQIKRGSNNFQLGKPVLTTIYDFEQLTYLKAVNMKALQIMIAIVQTFSDNYPESLRSLTVINAPSYFSWIFAALKPFIPSAVLSKLRIFGTDGWKEALLEKIDAEELPACLGGKKTDPDGNPLCKTFIARGQPIPKSYYKQMRKKKLAMESHVEKLIVMPFSKQEIPFIVNEENSYLEWEFETKNRDIDFSLLFRDSSDGMDTVELIPKQRIETCHESEKGCFRCENLGNYIIVFDNSYSWFHSKEVYYTARVNRQRNKLYKST